MADLGETSRLPSSDVFEAASRGRLAQILNYLNQGGNVNARNLFQSQMLHVCAKEGHVELAAVLLDRGAEINSLDYAGMRRTALHWACQQLVELLVERGANIKVWCNLDWVQQAQGKAWSQLVQGQKCGKMIDTAAPFGHSPASLCKHDALKLALERPPWSPEQHHRFPIRFRDAVKLLLRAVTCPAEDGSSREAEADGPGDEDPCQAPAVAGGWCLPGDVLVTIISRMAYPISDWVEPGDWDPPETILHSNASLS